MFKEHFLICIAFHNISLDIFRVFFLSAHCSIIIIILLLFSPTVDIPFFSSVWSEHVLNVLQFLFLSDETSLPFSSISVSHLNVCLPVFLSFFPLFSSHLVSSLFTPCPRPRLISSPSPSPLHFLLLSHSPVSWVCAFFIRHPALLRTFHVSRAIGPSVLPRGMKPYWSRVVSHLNWLCFPPGPWLQSEDIQTRRPPSSVAPKDRS